MCSENKGADQLCAVTAQLICAYAGSVYSYAEAHIIVLRPVVQIFISLTLSLSPQFVNYISTSKAHTQSFFVEKM